MHLNFLPRFVFVVEVFIESGLCAGSCSDGQQHASCRALPSERNGECEVPASRVILVRADVRSHFCATQTGLYFQQLSIITLGNFAGKAYPADVMATRTQISWRADEFKLGINMAGAISAGAYTAGVLDFLMEALEEWEKAKVAFRAYLANPSAPASPVDPKSRNCAMSVPATSLKVSPSRCCVNGDSIATTWARRSCLMFRGRLDEELLSFWGFDD